MAAGRSTLAEFKILAQGKYVIVAKRAASALASSAGFSLEAIDDLNIAIAQACEKAIAAGDRMWGPGNATLKLTFKLVEGGLEVDVRTLGTRIGVAEEANRQAIAQREAQLRARSEAQRLRAARELDLDEVAVNMIRLFVDELRYNVDAQGTMRMRMVKYLVD